MGKKLFSGALVCLALLLSFSACNNDEKKVVETPKLEAADVFPADSFAFYENVLAKDSLNTQLHLALATNYYAEKQFDKAIEHLTKVCSLEKENLEAIIILGNVFYDATQYENAIVYYEKALVLDAKDLNVRCDLATCYLNIKKTDKAFALLKKNLEMDSKHAQSHHNLSVVYKEMGKTKESDEEMKIFNSLNK